MKSQLLSSRARSALRSSHGVIRIEVPPAYGGLRLCEEWARESGATAVYADGSDPSGGADGLVQTLRRTIAGSQVEAPGTGLLIVTGVGAWSGDVLAQVCARLEPIPGWRIVLVDETATTRAVIAGSTVLRAGDLVLERGEVAAALGSPDPAADGRVDELWAATLGWPGLVAEAIEQVGLRDGHGPWNNVAGYLVRSTLRRELLPWIPPEWRTVITYLCLAGPTSVREIEVLADPHASAALEVMMGHRITRAAQQETVELIPEVRRLIADESRRRGLVLDEDVPRTIAETRFGLGILDAGLSAAYRLHDWGLCARIIERWWWRLQFDGYHKLGNKVTLSLPEEALRSSPVVGLHAEVMGILPVGTTPIAVAASPAAIHRACREGDALQLLEASYLGSVARRMKGDLAEATAVVDRAARLADRVAETDLDRAVGFTAFWYLHAGITHQLAGDDEAARDSYRRGWRVRDADMIGFAAQDLAAKQALLDAHRGDNPAARQWIAEARSRRLPNGWAAKNISLALLHAELSVAMDSLEDPPSSKWLDGYAGVFEHDDMWPFFAAIQARASLGTALSAAALTMLDEASASHPGSVLSDGVHAALLGAARAELHLALGRGTQAELALAPFGDHPVTQVARIRLQLASGDTETALAMASWRIASGQPSPRELTDLLLLRCSAEVLLGREVDAAATASSAAKMVCSRSAYRALTTLPPRVVAGLEEVAPDLHTMVEKVHAHGLGPVFPDAVEIVRLTEREQALLQGLVANRSLDGLAEDLYVSKNTVKTQLRAMYAKLGAHSRTQAVEIAGALGLVASDYPVVMPG